MTPQERRVAMSRSLGVVAMEHLGVTTLDERGADSLDFYNLPVWKLKRALEAAFLAGIKEGGR